MPAREFVALARSARAERHELPRLRSFLPLLRRRQSIRRRPASGASDLVARAASLPRGSAVLQLQPVRAEETVALALGCRKSGARLRVHWPLGAPAAAFAAWHGAVIASGSLPEVEIVSETDNTPLDVALVHSRP